MWLQRCARVRIRPFARFLSGIGIPSSGGSPFPPLAISDANLTDYVTEGFAGFAEAAPAHTPALLDGITGDARSWADLLHDVSSVGAALGAGVGGAAGLGAGDVLALVSPNHVDYFSCLHAALRLGAAVNPVNPVLTAAELESMLRACRAKVVVAHPQCLAPVLAALASLAADRRGSALVPELVVLEDTEEPAPGEARPLVPPSATRYDELRWSAAAASAAAAGRPPPPPPAALAQTPIDSATHVAALPYSSGTTGAPKGVMLTHRNLVANIQQCDAPEFDFYGAGRGGSGGRGGAVISPLPMFHIYPFLVTLGALLRTGHPYVTMKRFELRAFCELVEAHRCSRAFIVPPIVLELAKSAEVERHDLSSLRWLCSAAAVLSPETEAECAARLGVSIKQCWGMSELSPIGTFTPDAHPDGAPSPVGSIGVAVADTEWRLIRTAAEGAEGEDQTPLDAGEAEVVGPGERGELCIRGPQVMAGYLDDPAKTAECLGPSGWLRTGDVAVADARGFLYVVDRIKELIKYKGHQVAPAELEATLLTHPALADACVVGVPALEEAHGELPRAYVVLKPQATVTAEELSAWMDERVNPFMRLRGGVRIVDEIPKSASGKLLRRLLKEVARAEG
jgi:acyl-CoA synthetase (AMP-forming)/AMP-acid ligase II